MKTTYDEAKLSDLVYEMRYGRGEYDKGMDYVDHEIMLDIFRIELDDSKTFFKEPDEEGKCYENYWRLIFAGRFAGYGDAAWDDGQYELAIQAYWVGGHLDNTLHVRRKIKRTWKARKKYVNLPRASEKDRYLYLLWQTYR
jgi:hypothetical protein